MPRLPLTHDRPEAGVRDRAGGRLLSPWQPLRTGDCLGEVWITPVTDAGRVLCSESDRAPRVDACDPLVAGAMATARGGHRTKAIARSSAARSPTGGSSPVQSSASSTRSCAASPLVLVLNVSLESATRDARDPEEASGARACRHAPSTGRERAIREATSASRSASERSSGCHRRDLSAADRAELRSILRGEVASVVHAGSSHGQGARWWLAPGAACLGAI